MAKITKIRQQMANLAILRGLFREKDLNAEMLTYYYPTCAVGSK